MKSKNVFTIGAISLLSVSSVFASEASSSSGIIVSKDIKHDLSRPLRHLKGKGLPAPSIKKIVSEKIPATQPVMSALVRINGFQGIGEGLGNYQVTSPLPDLNAGLGMKQYVEYADSSLAVFDKATGKVATGFPKPANAVWAGFGGLCETSAAGPMVIKYDQLAKRWVLSQFAGSLNNGPFGYCIAVSTSEDATGTYNRYAYQFDSFSGYSRFGLWPDAYYTAFNMLGPVITGPLLCAFQRDQMLLGLPASNVCLPAGNLQKSGLLLPVDLVGKLTPSVGSPQYFIGLYPPDRLGLFRFHVDFVNTGNSTLTLVSIPVAAYVESCANNLGVACAVQPNTTNRLDVHSDRLMNRFSYRQFPNFGAMVATHTVQGPAPKFSPALRWYELRLLPGINTPIVYQQATLAPDSSNRFLGSIAMDRFTNIAIGYTISTSLVHPSPELSYHNYTDGLNMMTIQPLVTGLGSQINGVTSWGADSKMLVDPVDECTFWSTNEYLRTTGSMNWSTFITHFKLAACK